MTKSYGIYSEKTAREIKDRVLGRRTTPGSRESSLTLEDAYYAVLTEDLDAATNPLDGFVLVEVRILKYDDYAARTMVLAEGDAGLKQVVHRFEGVSAERGTLITIKKIKNEWLIDGIDCDVSAALVEALDALE